MITQQAQMWPLCISIKGHGGTNYFELAEKNSSCTIQMDIENNGNEVNQLP